jgi:hypothetical protein
MNIGAENLTKGWHHPIWVRVHILDTWPNEILGGALATVMLVTVDTLTRIIFVNIQVEASLTARGVRGRILFTVREHHVGTVWLS